MFNGAVSQDIWLQLNYTLESILSIQTINKYTIVITFVWNVENLFDNLN